MLITIGRKSIGNAPYRIDPHYHINAQGSTGKGKSSLLETTFIEFLKKGHGGLFLDPHGDTVDRLLLLIPKNRTRDIIWIDPDADAVPAFNPLYFKDPTELELAKESCITLLRALSGTDAAWGNETPHNVRNALDTVCERVHNPTLVHLYRFVVDDEYRDTLLGRTDNIFVRLFRKALQKLRPSDQAIKLAPAINKLSKLMRPNILPIIGQPTSLDLLDLMNTNKIILCRLSKGRLGDETAQILYSIILTMFSIAALQRERQEIRPDFLIVADEAQNGVHGGRFGTLLAEARMTCPPEISPLEM
jgi:hypothetical protein